MTPLTSSTFFFFFNDTATTEIYTLSLHDALPLSAEPGLSAREKPRGLRRQLTPGAGPGFTECGRRPRALLLVGWTLRMPRLLRGDVDDGIPRVVNADEQEEQRCRSDDQ